MTYLIKLISFSTSDDSNYVQFLLRITGWIRKEFFIMTSWRWLNSKSDANMVYNLPSNDLNKFKIKWKMPFRIGH